MSAEKGTFFETVIQTNLQFVKNKLEFAVAEAINGEDPTMLYTMMAKN